MNLKIISAGAGSGKTYRLTQELSALLSEGKVAAKNIMATTFTKKAAAELLERVQAALMQQQKFEAAEELEFAMIGTVHAVATQLLKRFALEAGISPEVNILAEEDSQRIFNSSIAHILDLKTIRRLNDLYFMLGMANEKQDWRTLILRLAEVARINKFSPKDIADSAQYSIETFLALLPTATEFEYNNQLLELIQNSIQSLEENKKDTTKKTKKVIEFLRAFAYRLGQKEQLPWKDHASLTSLDVAVKSKEIVEPLMALAARHEELPAFQNDIKSFIETLLNLVSRSIQEFQQYKQERGLIDYTDMEVLVSDLLEKPYVRQAVQEDIKLLMVDEFQDTNPIQLEIFWKLTQLVDQAIWVGDPKQSIYGFRGAEPALMQEIIKQTGGLKPENIQDTSYRSRKDLVNFANGIFVQAFGNLQPEQIVLKPHRSNDISEASLAIQHWHFEPADSGRRSINSWMYQSIAWQVQQFLNNPPVFEAKDGQIRKIEAGDIAILCRRNAGCMQVADALNTLGIPASSARSGLVQTLECKLVLAALRFLINRNDTLAIAEIKHFLEEIPLNDIFEERKQNLQSDIAYWQAEGPILDVLRSIQSNIAVQSAGEILAQVIEKTNILAFLNRLPNARQRLDNIEILKKYALNYEDYSERRRAPATLAGLVHYLEDLGQVNKDFQATQNQGTVQVMTYHKSKGLEWPCVILSDLWAKPWVYPWGQKLQAATELNLDDILRGRKLSYWPNPYDRGWQKTNLGKRLEAEVLPNEIKKEREESARLLYVGITRARDYLVIPTSAKAPPRALNAIFLNDEDAQFLFPDSNEIQFEWQQMTLYKETITVTPPDTIEALRLTPKNPEIWERPNFDQEYKPLFTDQFGKAAPLKTFEHLTLSKKQLGYEYNYLTQMTPLLTHFFRKYLVSGQLNTLESIANTFKRSSVWQPEYEHLIAFEKAYANLLNIHLGNFRFYQVDLIVNKSYAGQYGRFKIDVILKSPDCYWALIFMQTSEVGASKRLLNRLATLKGACQNTLKQSFDKPVFFGALGISNEEIYIEKET